MHFVYLKFGMKQKVFLHLHMLIPKEWHKRNNNTIIKIKRTKNYGLRN